MCSCREKKEEGELEEFEMLEQYADDNASFLSSLSAVNRVLQGNSPRKKLRTSPMRAIAKPDL